MSESRGSVSVGGKVILAGEHSVVRGGGALVLPLRSRKLTLTWEKSPAAGLQFSAETPEELAVAFRAALARALAAASYSLPQPGYLFQVSSDIPVRAGLGSSAALSVAIVRFLGNTGAAFADPFAVALEIENLFHGKSSGLDVACALLAAPIRYSRTGGARELSLAWKPHFYLRDTGRRSSTRDCVALVERAARPDLDQRMGEAVAQAEAALGTPASRGLAELARSFAQAASCFEEWGLGAAHEIQQLREAGALAAKPTGSGGGGFLLSLWASPPPAELGLIPVWEDSSTNF